MFNMKQIGKKITELRKKNNMTQMELADDHFLPFMDEDDITELALKALKKR